MILNEQQQVAAAFPAAIIVLCFGCSKPNCQVETRTLTDQQRTERTKIITPFAAEITVGSVPIFDTWTGSEIPSLRGKQWSDVERLLELADRVQHYRKEQRSIYFFFKEPAFGNIEAPELGAVIISIRNGKVEAAWSPPGPEY